VGDLDLVCLEPGHTKPICRCEKDRPKYWQIQSSEETQSCMVTKFGPCGHKHGLKLDCKRNLTCRKDSYCIDPDKPKSDENEGCQITANCKKGLRCNSGITFFKCIKPKSTPKGGICNKKPDCKDGLECVPRYPDPNMEFIEECRPLSGVNGRCIHKRGCQKDLRCNEATNKCIKPKSIDRGGKCDDAADCKEGLGCDWDESEWGSKVCGSFKIVVGNVWLILICLAFVY